MDFQIGMVEVAALVLGITQGIKAIFDVEGKAAIVTAFGVGFVSVAISHGIGEGLIPAEWVPWIDLVYTSLAGALAAIGAYSFGKRTGLIRETNGK